VAVLERHPLPRPVVDGAAASLRKQPSSTGSASAGESRPSTSDSER
jgi:hypothetical protein